MDTCLYIQIVLILTVVSVPQSTICMSTDEKRTLRIKVLEMFDHAYNNYMEHAYPADELMPLSCRGRYRGTQPSRGDIDDTLGNFSLTLIDTLDTLVVLGKIDEFEKAAVLVIDEVSFDQDIVVSVFETNIRVLGGLLGGHVMAAYLKSRKLGMEWYGDELLDKAKDIGYRLLPAFNTTTGMPYPRVNLRYGVKHDRSRTGGEKDTCTACAGTMILEFSALSRLTGDHIFEEKAHTAMEYLWQSRHRSSDLVGTVINIHNGDWIRRDSGVGAGIDSYYEYVLKAYILLGDETYLERFNKHYAGIRKYISQGPMLVDVHMHKPFTNSRNFMDALLAFWPGLLTLIGDLKPAIEIHEMLYQMIQRHNFLPEAFTTDFRVHWAQHPLRPEFLESTYFLYRATGDSHYLDVGKEVLYNLDTHARVKCGFAAIKDVTAVSHEDQMDSYVLAETFKYLYLLFSDPADLILDIDQFVFTTEAHLLPLSLSIHNISNGTRIPEFETNYEDDKYYERTCPNTHHIYESNYAKSFREPLKNFVDASCPTMQASNRPRLKAADFVVGNKAQMELLSKMGISIITMNDGRVQLLHTASEASSTDDAEDGMLFMQEMIELSKNQLNVAQHEPRVIQFMTPPYLGLEVLTAGPAQFGHDLKADGPVSGTLHISEPFNACDSLVKPESVRGRIAIVQRGDCMFIDKARNLQNAGALAGIIVDNHPGTASGTEQMFAMSGDGKNDVTIPLLFLYQREGLELMEAVSKYEHLQVYLGYKAKTSEEIMKDLLGDREQRVNIAKHDERTFNLEIPDTSDGFASMSDTSAVLKTADTKPNVETPTGSSKPEELEMIQTITGPGNTKRLRLQLDKARASKENIGQILEKLVTQLIKHTNFQSLENNEKYLIAITKMLDAVAQNNYNLIDANSLNLLQKLNTVLKPKEIVEEVVDVAAKNLGSSSFKDRMTAEIERMLDDYISSELKKIVRDASAFIDKEIGVTGEQTDETSTEEEIHLEPQHYANEEDLNEYLHLVKDVTSDDVTSDDGAGEKRFLPANIKQAPDWMKLEKGQVIVATDGYIYADLKDSYWEWIKDGMQSGEDVRESSLETESTQLQSEQLQSEHSDEAFIQQETDNSEKMQSEDATQNLSRDDAEATMKDEL